MPFPERLGTSCVSRCYCNCTLVWCTYGTTHCESHAVSFVLSSRARRCAYTNTCVCITSEDLCRSKRRERDRQNKREREREGDRKRAKGPPSRAVWLVFGGRKLRMVRLVKCSVVQLLVTVLSERLTTVPSFKFETSQVRPSKFRFFRKHRSGGEDRGGHPLRHD